MNTLTPHGRPQPSLSEILEARHLRATEITPKAHAPVTDFNPSPRKQHDPFPLTDIQQAYWVGRQTHLELGSTSTHGYSEIEMARLDPEVLEGAFNQVIARHDMLRAIVGADGMQRVQDHTPRYAIPVVDLSHAKEHDIRQHLDTLRNTLSHQTFELGVWPMFELRLTQLPDAVSRLHFSVDLTLLDDSSIRLLFSDLEALIANPTTPLPAPPALTYRDYVMFREAQKQTADYAKAQEYWQQRIEFLAPPPALPTRPTADSNHPPRFNSRSFRLPSFLYARLAKRAAATNVTLTSTVLTLFAETLRQWAKAPDFTLNLTMSDRQPVHAEVERLLGNFTSLALVEIRKTDGSFAEKCQFTQRQLWEVLEHSQYSGVAVMRDLARRKGDFTSALMPVVFTSALTGGNVNTGRTSLGKTVFNTSQTPQVCLDHQLFEDNGELVFNWDSVDLFFPEGMLDDMFCAYKARVEQAISETADWLHPQQGRLAEVHEQARRAYNATHADFPNAMLHQGFLTSVDRVPENIAVISDTGKWTYRAIYIRAAALAAKLAAAGVRRHDRVAICMPKGPEQIVAVLGILFAGAAYVPVDVRWPASRRSVVLNNATPQLVLTDERTEISDVDIPIIRVSMTEPETLSAPVTALGGSSSDVAYIIFTSGSTGVPKGVVIDHRGAWNTVYFINHMKSISQTDRFIALSELSFDLSVYDIFGAFSAGAALVMPAPSDVPDVENWARIAKTHNVTIWNSVPALLQMYVDYLETNSELRPTALRFAMASGDWVPLSLYGKLKTLLPKIEMWSLGGATEASIWSIYFPISEINPDWPSVPYGRPLPNQTVHVLDDQFAQRPVYVPGDLYIGGIGVAKGYWNDADRTTRQFVTHPETGEVLYKTGDIGRFINDDTVQFLGRADNQVKLSGYRVELGEIEAQIERVEGVARSVCRVLIDTRGKQRLVAYILPRQAQIGALFKESFTVGPIPDYHDKLNFKLGLPGRRSDLSGRPIALPITPNDVCSDRNPAFFRRRSFRHFTGQAVDADDLSKLLACISRTLIRETGLPKARYGSAGSLFPVQCYITVPTVSQNGIVCGHYYYDPHAHRLIETSAAMPDQAPLFDDSLQIAGAPALEIVLVADLDAITPLYAEKALHFATLEAGMITQLLEETAPNLHLGLCQSGWVNKDVARVRFGLGAQHVILHGLIGGRIIEACLGRDGYIQEHADEANLLHALQPQVADLDEAINTALARTLPHYMRPNRLVYVDDLPLSANGKVDVSRLPLPDIEQPPSERPVDQAPNAQGGVVRQVVRELIGLADTETDENFFDLGADSLTLVRLHSRLQEKLDRKFPIVEIFRNPTLRALNAYLLAVPGGTQLASSESVGANMRRARSQLKSLRSRLSERGD